MKTNADLGLFVQSIVSSTKLLFKNLFSLTEFTKSLVVIFFAEKNVRCFCRAKAPHIFTAKNGSVFVYNTFEKDKVREPAKSAL